MVAPSAYDTVAVLGVPALPNVQPSSGSTSAPPWSVHTRRSEAVNPQPPYRAACEHSRHLVTGFKADPLGNASPRLALARRGGFPQAQGAVPVPRSLRAYGLIVEGWSQQRKSPPKRALWRCYAVASSVSNSRTMSASNRFSNSLSPYLSKYSVRCSRSKSASFCQRARLSSSRASIRS